MTEQDKNRAIKFAFAGGITKLVTGILFTVFEVKGVWFVGNSISHVCFWMAFTILFEKNKRAAEWANFFLLLSVNDSVDEIFFDNTKFGWNEWLFFCFGNSLADT